MRVALRRVRAGLSVVRPLVEPDGFSQELAWLAKALGEVRDRDVLLEILREDFPDELGLAVAMKLERDRALDEARSALKSERYRNLLVRSPVLARDAPMIAIAPEVLRRREKKWRKACAHAERPEEWHDARIHGKKLRYALELFAPETPFAGEAADRLGKLQDVLGSHHDLYVLHVWALERNRSLEIDLRPLERKAADLAEEVGGYVSRARRAAERRLRRAWRS
jgi:CHAD domain-containing protein